MRLSMKSSGAALSVLGALFTTATPHPSILGDRSVAEVVVATGGWAAMHYAVLVGCIFGVFGVGGIVAVHRGRLGRAGEVTLFFTIVGLVVSAGVMAVEAVLFPEVARRAPEVLAVDGPVLGLWPLRIAASTAAGFPLGMAALGWLAYRDGAYRGPGIALAASGVGWVVIAGPFVPYVYPFATALFGAAIGWWGWILLSTGSSPDARAASVPQ
jgi:hypothetical protein